MHVHVVGPVDLGDLGVEVGKLGGRLKVETALHRDHLKLVEDLEVAVQLLPDAVLVENVEVQEQVRVVLVAGDVGLVTVEKAREDGPHKSPQYPALQIIPTAAIITTITTTNKTVHGITLPTTAHLALDLSELRLSLVTSSHCIPTPLLRDAEAEDCTLIFYLDGSAAP